MSDETSRNDTEKRLEAVKESVKRSVEGFLVENDGGALTDEQTADIRMGVFRGIYGDRKHTNITKSGEVYEITDFRGISVDDMVIEDTVPFGEANTTVRFSLTAEPRANTIYGGLPDDLREKVQNGDRVITVGLARYVLAPEIGCDFEGSWLFAEKVPNPPVKREQ